MAEHRVAWQIDIEAASALEAAKEARRFQVVPFTTAKAFDVVRTDGSQEQAERIDLCACTPEGPDPSDVLLDVIEAFPGLVDGTTDVNGADLVALLTNRLHEMAHLDDFRTLAPGRIKTD